MSDKACVIAAWTVSLARHQKGVGCPCKETHNGLLTWPADSRGRSAGKQRPYSAPGGIRNLLIADKVRQGGGRRAGAGKGGRGEEVLKETYLVIRENWENLHPKGRKERGGKERKYRFALYCFVK